MMPKLKTIIVGEGSSGKTTLATRFMVRPKFPEFHPCTYCVNKEGVFSTDIGSFAQDYKEKTVHLAGKELTLECWDTGGQEKFRTVTASFYRDADVVLFCCAVDDRIHFTALDDWLEQYKRASSANASEVALQVVLTKSDLGPCSFENEVKAWATKNNAEVCLTSSKTGENVEKAFHDPCVRVLHARAAPAVVPVVVKKTGCVLC